MASLKIWNGSAWVNAGMKVWDGSAWHGYAQYFDGSVMVPLEVTSATVPLVTDIEIYYSDATAANNVGIIFHDYRIGVGGDDGRILTKRHKTVYIDMGDDDQSSPVDHTGEWTGDTIGDLSLWEVACTSLVSGTWDTEFAAVGVYSGLNNQDMLWNVNRTGGKGRTPGTSIVSAVFRIREVADTANYTEFSVLVTNVQT